MKITSFQVLDPLDWGVREQPYLVVAIDERLTGGKEKFYTENRVIQYGPFFEWHSPYSTSVGRFNTLDADQHSPRLIGIQLSIAQGIVAPWYMDLKRARYELKKVQREQEWVIRLDQNHAERTGEMVYVPVRLRNGSCGGWDTDEEMRCKRSDSLTLVHAKSFPVFLCPAHLAEESRMHFDRRASA